MGNEAKPVVVPPSAPQSRNPLVAFLLVVFLVIAVGILLAVVLTKKSPKETEHARYNREAKEVMLAYCTNSLVGLNRFISIDLRHFTVGPKGEMLEADIDDPHNWEGKVVAEYVNHMGGIDRTNFLFRFTLDTNEFRIPKNCVTLDHYWMAEGDAIGRAADFDTWLKSLNSNP